MTCIERIKKAYDINVMTNGFLAIATKGQFPTKLVLPSKNCRLYFMFGEEFKKTTIDELILKRKAIKITALNLYRIILEEKEFIKSIKAYDKFKFKGHQAV
ncbi:MAG: hypothetical protein H7Y18_03420 [Clostridiaceae bacterium]|nr:hypothetical protein [Clostridiaceae bacterium]